MTLDDRASATAVDAELVRRAVEGDEEALVRLLETHGPEVERSLRIADRHRAAIDPADVMQVSYLEAAMRIATFDPLRAPAFPAWLARIAHNNLCDAVRGLERKRRPPPALRIEPAAEASAARLFDELFAASSTPSRTVGRGELAALVDRALSALPPDYAEVVRRYDLAAEPIALTCAALGRSAGAVHMMRARAHDRLRVLLAAVAAAEGGA